MFRRHTKPPAGSQQLRPATTWPVRQARPERSWRETVIHYHVIWKEILHLPQKQHRPQAQPRTTGRSATSTSLLAAREATRRQQQLQQDLSAITAAGGGGGGAASPPTPQPRYASHTPVWFAEPQPNPSSDGALLLLLPPLTRPRQSTFSGRPPTRRGPLSAGDAESSGQALPPSETVQEVAHAQDQGQGQGQGQGQDQGQGQGQGEEPQAEDSTALPALPSRASKHDMIDC
ncbi:hypothetical protein B0T26DRAFT_799702 [Lasiosphaeria miniovina]|uniref:Uncharacterized protein n=1 Tax=Lasiosphaeria miniovina TaxID=1954250 RepID=A0AA40E5E5_9PEZI|nr:uncharacterized protein B0T26DRAFT_799702 [Lasiosphaeria miniovina]KAK0727790.1 hypothetical protein B0T26DRAFT_799702 [Lasiosphaeria miniovina]